MLPLCSLLALHCTAANQHVFKIVALHSLQSYPQSQSLAHVADRSSESIEHKVPLTDRLE